MPLFLLPVFPVRTCRHASRSARFAGKANGLGEHYAKQGSDPDPLSVHNLPSAAAPVRFAGKTNGLDKHYAKQGSDHSSPGRAVIFALGELYALRAWYLLRK